MSIVEGLEFDNSNETNKKEVIDFNIPESTYDELFGGKKDKAKRVFTRINEFLTKSIEDKLKQNSDVGVLSNSIYYIGEILQNQDKKQDIMKLYREITDLLIGYQSKNLLKKQAILIQIEEKVKEFKNILLSK